VPEQGNGRRRTDWRRSEWHSACFYRSVLNLFAHIDPLHQALDFHLERHNLLASNLAQIDTPRFKPLDLARAGDPAFHSVFQVALERTQVNHIALAPDSPQIGRVFEDLSGGGGADGNFVSLEREAGKIAANRLRYDLVSVLTKSQLDGLMSAAGDGRGG
jgi:flagellar basal-body rod protein FlgB